MISDYDWNRLIRYVTGECDPGEARETLRWINSDPERVHLSDELSSLHRAGGMLSRHWDLDAAWRKVAAPLPGLRPVSAPRRAPAFPGSRRAASLATRIAAGLIVALSAGAFWSLVRHADRAGPRATSSLLHETTTQRGQLLQLRLGDGTRITLAAASRIRYARDFGVAGRPREVYLDGQAMFDVAHDEARPFRVHAHHAVAEDIGTRFVVRSYTEDGADRVAVAEGIVGLRQARDSVVLRRGDVATAAPGVRLRAMHGLDIGADTAWVRGRLVFRDTPLRQAILELARWYDVKIELADPAIGDRLLTAVFADVPADAVLADLGRTLQLHVERVGQVLRLSQR